MFYSPTNDGHSSSFHFGALKDKVDHEKHSKELPFEREFIFFSTVILFKSFLVELSNNISNSNK